MSSKSGHLSLSESEKRPKQSMSVSEELISRIKFAYVDVAYELHLNFKIFSSRRSCASVKADKHSKFPDATKKNRKSRDFNFLLVGESGMEGNS